MAYSIRSRKTEHSGAKHGSGAYWGRKAIAKRASDKERRRESRRVAAEENAGRLTAGHAEITLRSVLR